MATVFETRLIGNIGKDAVIKNMERGVIAINFPVAHNKNWRDKKTGESKTKTTWINCTIWKKDGSSLRILDFLKRGALVELEGTPFAKAFAQEDGTIKSEIRLNVSKTNILKTIKNEDIELPEIFDCDNFIGTEENFSSTLEDFIYDETDL